MMCQLHVVWRTLISSCGSGHSGCCSPGLCEQKRSQDIGFSHAAPSRNDILAGPSKTAGNACCHILGCLGHQDARLARCTGLTGMLAWPLAAMGRALIPYTWPTKLRVGDVFRKSAGIPGVAVLVCANKRGARTDYRL